MRSVPAARSSPSRYWSAPSGRGPAQATPGSLVVVGVPSLTGAITAYRAGNVLLGRGVTFGLLAIGGAAAGANASALVSEPGCWRRCRPDAGVGGVMAAREVRAHRAVGEQESDPDTWVLSARRHQLDDPIITFSPTFACQSPRALKVLVTATEVGLLTGLSGSGAGSSSSRPYCSPSRCLWSTPSAPPWSSSELAGDHTHHDPGLLLGRDHWRSSHVSDSLSGLLNCPATKSDPRHCVDMTEIVLMGDSRIAAVAVELVDEPS